MANEKRSVSFVAISGINFPVRSRKYMVDLVKDIVQKTDSKFVVIAGHTIDGSNLEAEKKQRFKELDLKFAAARKKSEPLLNKKGQPADKTELRLELVKDFVAEQVGAFNEFLPKIKDVNYHIVVAEKIYDKPLGKIILEELAGLRDDIRVFDDPEAKIPVQLPGFGEMRVLVPRKTPWFYENVTGLMQRLINSFALKTFSPKPPLILVGCTGVGALIPSYKGVPSIALPACNKIDEQISTENMVGCTVITITEADDNGFDISWHVEDFRTVVFNEKELALPDNLQKCHSRVLDVLKPGSASLSTIEFRLNTSSKRPWKKEKVKQAVDELVKRKLITYNKAGNRFSISDGLAEKARISYEEFKKGARSITTVDKSCWHVGALKTMYYTILEDEPRLAVDADAIIMNGDMTQGVSHNYEYNGEMVPIMNGPDKHQGGAAKMQARILMDVFRMRWEKLKREKLETLQLIKKCLIQYRFKYGNHDEPRFNHGKDTRPLWLFEEILLKEMVDQIMTFLDEHKHNNVTFKEVRDLVHATIVRIGESRVTTIDGVPIGVKHPYQSRTKSKGARPREAIDFYMQYVRDWPDTDLHKVRIVKVANFHEAAAIFFGGFGNTYLSVMTGAQVYDTLFESNQNKIVDYGLAKTTVEFNEQGQILSGTVRYSRYISTKDKRILFKDDLSADDVSRLSKELSEQFNIPWR